MKKLDNPLIRGDHQQIEKQCSFLAVNVLDNCSATASFGFFETNFSTIHDNKADQNRIPKPSTRAAVFRSEVIHAAEIIPYR
ncbi:hypothetical protein [Roseovarius arcticus]|uniref:hypothetical protein n=1 Tax=Roseovarius arcticus TaxID=2547404 RepID=UPI001110AECB|nr:hypothetical protein [Roseovarius arcticus]